MSKIKPAKATVGIEVSRYQQMVEKVQAGEQQRLVEKFLEAKVEQLKEQFLEVEPDNLALHQALAKEIKKMLMDLKVTAIVVPDPE